MLHCRSHKLSKRLSIQSVWVHVSSHEIELSCTPYTLVPIWMWWLYSLGHGGTRYISMATLLQRGHGAGDCSWGTKIHAELIRVKPESHSIHTFTLWLNIHCMAQQQVSGHALSFMCKAGDFFFSSLSFLLCYCSSTKVHCLWHILKARLPEMTRDKIITDMKVKHITQRHERHESSEDIVLKYSCVFKGKD